MPTEKFTTTLVPFETKVIHTGTNAKGDAYTIYQVRARNLQGQEIVNYPLRSFEQLTLHEPVEVDCQLYDGGDRYGISYTLKPKGNKKQSLGPRVGHLEAQMREVFARMGMEYLPVQGQQEAPPAAPPPAPAPAPPPAAAPPSPPPPAPAPVSAPPPAQPDPPTQVAPSHQVQPEPPGGYGTHNSFGGDDDIPF